MLSSPANSKACTRIPYATEQGISKRVSGNLFVETGNFQAKSKRPLIAH
jgi:hypothetical protein